MPGEPGALELLRFTVWGAAGAEAQLSPGPFPGRAEDWAEVVAAGVADSFPWGLRCSAASNRGL